MSADIVGICGRLAAAGLGVALLGMVGAAPASAAASPNASCVGQIVSAAAPATVTFGANVVTVQVADSEPQFGQTKARVTAPPAHEPFTHPQSSPGDG